MSVNSDMENTERDYQLILQATIDNTRKLVKKYLSGSMQHDFLLWILDDKNIHRDRYLQTTGITKTTELMVSLLSGFTGNIAPSDKFFAYLGALNTYLAFEVVSDNLAIGLAIPKKGDSNWQSRQEILLNFNNIIQQKLFGEEMDALTLLKPYAKLMESISGFEQSLGPEELRQFAELFSEGRFSNLNCELEYSVLPQLALNIESCTYVAKLMFHHPIFPFLRASLGERYSTISTLIEVNQDTVSLSKLMDYGTKTILVEPTLLFVISALDSTLPNSSLPKTIDNKLLLMASREAAALVRLLNDLGTELLSVSQESRLLFKNELYHFYQENARYHAFENVFDLLEKFSENNEFFRSLTRIRKDIRHGEFNICLHNLKKIKDIRKAVAELCQNLDFFSEIYQQKLTKFNFLLDEVSKNLEDETPSSVIRRFVHFHQKLYAKEYETNKGEYAIPHSVNNVNNNKSNRYE